jgi:hypothetical protein
MPTLTLNYTHNRAMSLLRIAVMLLACVAPSSAQTSRARESKAIPAGEVTVTINEQTFNALLEALFTLPQPPTFPLGQGNSSAECPGAITLEREVSGARTAVHFRDGRIDAPVAFSGTYGAPVVGCLKFRGWADAALNLTFDPAKQALIARVQVREVHLENVPSLFASGITGLVQDALDARINPIEILRAEQLSAELPLRKLSSGGSLRLRAKDVRHEIVASELRLHVVYEFVRVD